MKKIVFTLVMLFSLNGCASLVIGSASTVALSTVQERTFDDAVDDTILKTKINSAWLLEDNPDMYRACSMTISEGRVLLTGVVTDEDQMLTAVKLTWQVDGVKEVYNEIIVNPIGKSFGESSRDLWIASKLRSKLLVAKDVIAINYSIDVNCGSVLLIGIAQDEQELNKVVDIVRNTGSVDSVISYIKLKSECY